MLTGTTVPQATEAKSDIFARYHYSVLWPIWQGFRGRQATHPRSASSFTSDLERCKQMTLLAMNYSARVEEYAHISIPRPWVTSLVHLLYNPSESCMDLLLSAEWQQILPFLAQIGCNLELRNGAGQTPFLLAASYLNFRCINELSKQGVDTSVRDASGRCAFDIVIRQYQRTYRGRSSDLSTTIMALLSAGCDPHASSMWSIARDVWKGDVWKDSVWGTCKSAFRNLGWTTQDIDELVDNNQSSSQSQYTRTLSKDLSPTATRDNNRETCLREIIVQSIEKDGYEENMDPSRSDPGRSLDRASSSTPSEMPEILERQEDQASLSPFTSISSPTARTLPDDSDHEKDNVDDLPEPFGHLNLGPDDVVTDEQDILVLSESASVDEPNQSSYGKIRFDLSPYVWYCCECNQLNNGALQPLCIGWGWLCEHHCCDDCDFEKVS